MAMAARNSLMHTSYWHSYGEQHVPQAPSLCAVPRSPQPSSAYPFKPAYCPPSHLVSSPKFVWNHLGMRERQVHHCKTFEDANSTAWLVPDRFLVRAITALAVFCSLPILFCGCAQAAEAIKASRTGLKVAAFLRSSGWQDEMIVFLMATLPVLELRGAIPVGYWMQLDPWKLSVLSVLGNMVPVPLILLYMEKLAKFLSSRSSTAKKIVDRLFESTRRKAEPVQEFEWLGLMLFVAVPFPGTGAWTGAMVASVLGMPFWDAMSANFLGVLMAGILVNLMVNLGLLYALLVGIALFLVSTFMWSFLRVILKKKE